MILSDRDNVKSGGYCHRTRVVSLGTVNGVDRTKLAVNSRIDNTFID